MTTVEKLFVQIFERKTGIIEKVKQQTELFNQHLASKLLIDGITPPSWLWNPTEGLDPTVLKKEELISELLLSRPQPTLGFSNDCFSLYNNSVTENQGEISGLFMKKGFKAQDVPTVAAVNNEGHPQCAPNGPPEQDVASKLPEDETDERISNICNAPDSSLARFQRSKSRQKALEYRSSAKAQARSRLSHENGIDIPPSSIGLLISASKHNDHFGEPPRLAEPHHTDFPICGDWNLGLANCQSEEKGMNIDTGRTTRARSSHEVSTFVSNSPADAAVGSSRDDAKASKTRSRSIPVSVQDGHIHEFSKLSEAFANSCQNCGVMDLDERGCQSKATCSNSNTSARTGSRSYRERNSYANDLSKSNLSSIVTGVDPIVKLRTDYVNGTDVGISCSNGPTESFRARESVLEDGRRHEENGADLSCSGITRFSRSGQQNPGISKDVDSPPHPAKADCEMLPPAVGSVMEHGTQVDPMVKLHTDYDNGSDVAISFSDGSMKSCRAQESVLEDGRSHKEKTADLSCSRITRFSGSGQQIPSISADLESPPHPANPLSPAGGSLVEYPDVSDHILGSGKPSVGLGCTVTLSQPSSGDKALIEPVNGSGKGETDYIHQNASGDKIVQPCGETSEIDTLQGNAKILVSNDLVSRDIGEQYVYLSSSDTKQGRELDCLNAPAPSDLVSQDVVGAQHVNFSPSDSKRRREMDCLTARAPSDCFMIVKPKQLDFDDMEEHNFNETSTSVSRDNSPGNICCSLSERELSLDKEFSGNINQLCSHKKSLEMSEVSTKGKEDWRGSPKPDVDGQLEIQTEKDISVMNEPPMSVGFENNLGAAVQIENSQMLQKADIILSNDLHSNEGDDSSQHMHTEDGAHNYEGKNNDASGCHVSKCHHVRPLYPSNSMDQASGEYKDCSIEKVGRVDSTCSILDERRQLHLREGQNFSCLVGEVSSKREFDVSCDKRELGKSPLQGENGLLTCASVGSLHHDDEILNNSNASDPQTAKKHSPAQRRFRPAEQCSWPQSKRRKIEVRQTNSFTTSPSFRVLKPYGIRLDPTSCLKNDEIEGDALLVDAFKEDRNLMDIIESAPESENFKGTSFSEKENNHRESISAINNKLLGESLILNSREDDARDTRECMAKEMTTPCSGSNLLDAMKPCGEQSSQQLLPLGNNFDLANSANLACLEKTFPEGKTHLSENRVSSQCSVPYPDDKDLDFVDVDQTMPVLEGFTVDAQEDIGEINIAGDVIDFNKLSLSRTTIERASILAQICKSASSDSPLSHFSSSFKFQETENLFQSVPNGLLEQLGTLPSNVNVDKPLGIDDCAVNTSKGMPYSDCPPYPGARFGWHSGNHYASPVGKLWERLSSNSGNSEKRLSSNPELTCFPIEEDFSISEENKTLDEDVDESQEEFDSSETSNHGHREPLKDLTNSSLNPPALVSSNGIQDKVKQSSEILLKNDSEANENKTSSLGANKFGKAKESFKNSINKPNLPRRTSVRQAQKLSLKETKRNNIIANVSSFIPLVQQKQAAAVCAGKRDVKVKALEAAEAAKRLEEERENQRKIRKEALKLERAKAEQENMRQKELDKKKREEERKKRDADMLAKKRQRDDEEKKQKEKKRMRIEVRQRQHREQEEKMYGEKAGKEKQRLKVHEQVHSNKQSNNESRQQQNREKAGCGVALREAEAKPVLSGVAMDGVQQTTIHLEGGTSEIEKELDVLNSSNKNDDFVNKSLEKSYEISPYHCSDDEDEDEDDLPSRKLIPSWASKSAVALVLPLQQEMDPDVIFPQGSFCSMDEVLLPRKLQQN